MKDEKQKVQIVEKAEENTIEHPVFLTTFQWSPNDQQRKILNVNFVIFYAILFSLYYWCIDLCLPNFHCLLQLLTVTCALQRCPVGMCCIKAKATGLIFSHFQQGIEVGWFSSTMTMR